MVGCVVVEDYCFCVDYVEVGGVVVEVEYVVCVVLCVG